MKRQLLLDVVIFAAMAIRSRVSLTEVAIYLNLPSPDGLDGCYWGVHYETNDNASKLSIIIDEGGFDILQYSAPFSAWHETCITRAEVLTIEISTHLHRPRSYSFSESGEIRRVQ